MGMYTSLLFLGGYPGGYTPLLYTPWEQEGSMCTVTTPLREAGERYAPLPHPLREAGRRVIHRYTHPQGSWREEYTLLPHPSERLEGVVHTVTTLFREAGGRNIHP